MINIFLIFYWILIVLAMIVAGMIVYHIWTYYLNKALAILTMGLFSVTMILLILINLAIASKINWSTIF
ncbi:MAG: hypothetical protein KAQ63_01685 [Candidatus Moranbacteria bacterium]|nr:hypothetical protein [Candidatus Moranbacteria bacterium]